MNTYFWLIEPKYMGRQQNYKVVIRYWSLVSRCHLSDRLTLLMYTRIDKCGERLHFKHSFRVAPERYVPRQMVLPLPPEFEPCRFSSLAVLQPCLTRGGPCQRQTDGWRP